MIKRSCCLFFIAALCSLTVLGTGFALWSFDSESVATRNLGVHVTQSTVLGEFYAPDIEYVVLDGGTGSGINATITGVSFYKADESGVAVADSSYVLTFTVDEKYRERLADGDNWEKVDFGIRIAVPEELKGIIVHTDFYESRIEGREYIDLKALTVELTDHFDDPEGVKSDFTYEKSTGVFSFCLTTTTLNRFFTYSPSGSPTTLAGYGNLGGNFAPNFVIELWQG